MFRLGVVAVFSGGCWCFQEELVDRVLICDLDVHQGDGTAEILKERQVDVKGLVISRYALKVCHSEPCFL